MPRRQQPRPSSPTADVPSTTATGNTSHLRKRAPKDRSAGAKDDSTKAGMDTQDGRPLLDGETTSPKDAKTWSRRNQWIIFALASGACAAFNGVFAKLTTTELTTRLSQAVARLFGLSAFEGIIEIIVRCIFFGLNLAFNGVMWTLFTTALARGDSTTQVSIMNTSSNFFITAILGLAIFSESLPPLWWVGAAMLVAGNVIIGRKDEGAKTESGAPGAEGNYQDDVASISSTASLAEDGLSAYRDVPQVPELSGGIPPEKDEDEDILDLGLEEETA